MPKFALKSEVDDNAIVNLSAADSKTDQGRFCLQTVVEGLARGIGQARVLGVLGAVTMGVVLRDVAVSSRVLIPSVWGPTDY